MRGARTQEAAHVSGAVAGFAQMRGLGAFVYNYTSSRYALRYYGGEPMLT